MNTLLCLVAILGANAYEDTFANANNAYNSGNYATAVPLYEQLVAESVANPVVFFNLGNAYYRAGRIGPAIANYERALQLNPNLDNARENLAKAVQETPHHLGRPAPPEWEQSLLFWHYSLSRRATNFLALASWFAFWALLAIRQWRPVRFARRGALAAFVLAMAFGLSAWDKAHPQLLAVASDAVVPVHYGTNENETVRFELNVGDRVLVDRQMNGWSRVTTAGGERGWAQDQGLAFVGPPYERPAEPSPAAAAEAKSG
jgi:tetratricopeptide (TPR) repeat protein